MVRDRQVQGASWFNMYGESKLSLMSQYHFCIAFENSRHVDYVTEKIFQVDSGGEEKGEEGLRGRPGGQAPGLPASCRDG